MLFADLPEMPSYALVAGWGFGWLAAMRRWLTTQQVQIDDIERMVINAVYAKRIYTNCEQQEST